MQVAVIGLGQMGLAFAERLLMSGHDVCGCDPDAERRAALGELGGEALASPVDVDRDSLVITSLPAASALEEVAASLAGVDRGGQLIVDTSTLSVEDKRQAARVVAEVGAVLLDATVSGTPDSVRAGKLALYASGDQQTWLSAEPVIRAFAAHARYVGEFGNAALLKLICNHLVAVHNVATAEAMSLAVSAGFDPELVYDVVRDGVASSRVWELRGRMVVDRDYRTGKSSLRIAQKDGALIDDLARQAGAVIPLFALAREMHQGAIASGLGNSDPAALFEYYRRFATPAA